MPDESHGGAALLAEYALDDAAEEPDLQALAEIATHVSGAPYAVVNLIDAHFQHQVAAIGISPSVCAREDSMCAVTVVSPEPVVVDDAREDARFAANPWVTGQLGRVRFYASSQLRTSSGAVLGTLCVFDEQPCTITARQRRSLDLLAHQVVDVLELRRFTRLLGAAVRDLTAARTELLRSNSELAAFAGRVSHDLRNPLAGLGGFLELLGENPAVAADPTAAHQVHRARAAAGRMHALVDELLEYARLGGTLRWCAVGLRRLLDELAEDQSATGLLDGVDLDVGPLPTVRGDATQLRALLQNLIVNAVRFARPDRRPVLRIGARRCPDHWRVEIADNGLGIPVTRREEAFELLAQVHPHGTVAGGSGIGLATCRRIVAAHGGSIGIDDGVDGGITVWFTLPPPPTEPSAAGAARRAGPAGRRGRPGPSGVR
jgi:signal transduction histidine kinase